VRLEPGFFGGDALDALDEVAVEAGTLRPEQWQLGLGREFVLSAFGRGIAADRWYDGEFGPDAAMAKAAPAHCGTCGFLMPIGGLLGQAFGVCANVLGADGRVVALEYGCGAHSSVRAFEGTGVPVTDIAVDDGAVEVVDLRAVPVLDDIADDLGDAVSAGAGDAGTAAGEDVDDVDGGVDPAVLVALLDVDAAPEGDATRPEGAEPDGDASTDEQSDEVVLAEAAGLAAVEHDVEDDDEDDDEDGDEDEVDDEDEDDEDDEDDDEDDEDDEDDDDDDDDEEDEDDDEDDEDDEDDDEVAVVTELDDVVDLEPDEAL